MKEPLTHGGTQDQQEKYIKILVQAATRNPPVRSLDPHNPYPEGTDPDCLEPLVRLGAIRASGASPRIHARRPLSGKFSRARCRSFPK